MSSYFDTEECKALRAERDALFFRQGGLRWAQPEIRLVDQKLADGRWHFEHPGLTGSWRIAIGGVVSFGGGIPRFETEADALAYIAAHETYGLASAVYLASRQTLEANEAAQTWKEAA